MAISAQRTMKEAFKIGGYAWHAHKRFEEIKNGWTFEKTVEWLETVGIRFGRNSIRNFVNVYATYQASPVTTTQLTDSYRIVNEQAENLLELPKNKIEILGNIFKALPSDDSTNPKELIRELIRAGKVFAVTERTIQRWKPESLKQKRLSQEEVKKIQDLKEQGKTNTEIAKELEVEEGAIRHHIRKLESFPIYDPNSPIPGTSSPESPEPSNVIKAPIEFKKPPVQKEVHVDPDYPDDDDEDEEDLDIETLDDEKLLVDPEWQLWSDNQIAKKCAVDHKTVAKIRNDLQKSDLGFPKIQERNFERNGKTHTMDTAKR